MGAIFTLLTSRVGAIVGWAGTAALAVALAWTTISARITEGTLHHQVASLQASIDDPKTGWRARLGQAEQNVVTLSDDIDAANKRADAAKAAADQAAARAAAANAKARVATENAAKQAVVTLGLKPGADHCASALELIRRP